MNQNFKAFGITLIYCIISVIWLLSSDSIVRIFYPSLQSHEQIISLKSWFHLFLTAPILYLLINRKHTLSNPTKRTLQQSEKNFKTLAENAFDGIIVYAGEENNVYVNQRMVEITGYSIEELLTMNPIDLAIPTEREKLKEKRKRRLKGEYLEQYETIFFRKDKTSIPVEIIGTRTYWHGLVASTIFVRDITDRKQVQETLLRHEKSFRNLVENSLAAIVIVQDNEIRFKNPEHDKLFGSLYKTQRFTDFDFVHEEDREKVRKVYRQVRNQKTQPNEIVFRFFTIAKKNEVSELKWVFCRINIIQYGNRKAVLFNIMDLTEYKKLEEMLIMQDKMSSLGRVAAGIAHEIRNPLSGINIYMDTIKKIIIMEKYSDKALEICNHILSASRKIESVIRRVMDFTKPHEPKFAAIDISQSVQDAITLSSVTLRKSGIQLETELTRSLPQCKADPNMIEQVVLNLITNAAEAMKDMHSGKKIRIRSVEKNNNVIIRVSDSGPGIPANCKSKIFDPFYSTKQGSTGIGLSICHRIILDHKGSLTVSKSILGGVSFQISIPAMKGSQL